MKKTIVTLSISLMLISSVFGASINSLFDSGSEISHVTVQGEVIGDIMIRGNNAWVNIKDTGSAIGIWMSRSNTRQIKYAGDYKNIGDLIEVEGIFHRQCQLHGGDTDIHATEIKVVREGSTRNIEATPSQISFAAATFLIFAFLYFLRKSISKRRFKIQSNKKI